MFLELRDCPYVDKFIEDRHGRLPFMAVLIAVASRFILSQNVAYSQLMLHVVLICHESLLARELLVMNDGIEGQNMAGGWSYIGGIEGRERNISLTPSLAKHTIERSRRGFGIRTVTTAGWKSL